jgi:hypothetical protein
MRGVLLSLYHSAWMGIRIDRWALVVVSVSSWTRRLALYLLLWFVCFYMYMLFSLRSYEVSEIV